MNGGKKKQLNPMKDLIIRMYYGTEKRKGLQVVNWGDS